MRVPPCGSNTCALGCAAMRASSCAMRCARRSSAESDAGASAWAATCLRCTPMSAPLGGLFHVLPCNGTPGPGGAAPPAPPAPPAPVTMGRLYLATEGLVDHGFPHGGSEFMVPLLRWLVAILCVRSARHRLGRLAHLGDGVLGLTKHILHRR